MSFFFIWRSFFLGFGRTNPDRNGPAGTRVYYPGGNRIEYRFGKQFVKYEKELHHASCPCFKCEFVRPYNKRVVDPLEKVKEIL